MNGYYARVRNGQELAQSFNAFLKRIAKDEEKQAAKENRPVVPIVRSDGVSLGSLRHTYGTVVDLVPDQKMIDLTMGHTNKSIQKRVYSQLNLDELKRLKALADTVRKWLYGEKGETAAKVGVIGVDTN